MDDKTFLSLSFEERRAFCYKKIADHTPPKSRHDEIMIKVYGGLLELHEKRLSEEGGTAGRDAGMEPDTQDNAPDR